MNIKNILKQELSLQQVRLAPRISSPRRHSTTSNYPTCRVGAGGERKAGRRTRAVPTALANGP